jgi:hypothetical protein
MMVQLQIGCTKTVRSIGRDRMFHDQDAGRIADGMIFVYIMGYETEIVFKHRGDGNGLQSR